MTVLWLVACTDDAEIPWAPAAPSPTESRQIVDVSFPEIYQTFLRRHVSTQVKAERWARQYKDHWVRWTGQLAAFSPNGLKMRHLQGTITFDVSLIVNEPQRSAMKKQLTVGKFYTYVARLDRFDDLFRTLYFDQCVVLNPGPEGIAGKLDPIPPPLKGAPVEQLGGPTKAPSPGPARAPAP